MDGWMDAAVVEVEEQNKKGEIKSWEEEKKKKNGVLSLMSVAINI